MVDVICLHGCRNIRRIIRHPWQMFSNFNTNAAVNSLSTSSSNLNICSLAYQLFPSKISYWFHLSLVCVRIWWSRKKRKLARKSFPWCGKKWTDWEGRSPNSHIFIWATLLCLSTQSFGHREDGQSLWVDKLPRLGTWGSKGVRT